MRIIVAMPLEAEHKAAFMKTASEVDAGIMFVNPTEVTYELAQSADIIVGNVRPEFIKDSKNLKLMQLISAGTDGYTEPGVLPKQAVLANATGSYGLAIAEHMMGMILSMMKRLDQYRINQEDHEWVDCGPVTSIYGSKTLVVGLGNIGNEFAVRMHAMGSEVSAIKRRVTEKPDYISKLYTMDDFYEAIKEADIVAASLPNTEATRGLFDEKAFASMKPGAYFINVGRGNAVDQDALCDALESGKLSGAALDVTVPEPLPSDHRLWDAPGILITPHVSGGYHLRHTHDTIVQIACNNIRHCVNGEPYETEVDMETGYKK